MDAHDLDRAIWNALTSGHAGLAEGAGRARRYPRDVSPLAAVEEPDPAAFADLAGLVGEGEAVALFATGPIPTPASWRVVKGRFIDLMVCEEPASDGATGGEGLVRAMSERDVPDMLELTALTQPGPFRARTIAMGRYFGIRAADGRLAAMAGERLKLARHTEVSAVCTHPEHTGKGYARALMQHVMGLVRAEGKTPFLHVKTENERAKAVYERLGFRVRRPIWFSVVEKA